MSYPSCESERLIFPASLRRSPAALVNFCLSDLARSTIFILLVLKELNPSTLYKVQIWICGISQLNETNLQSLLLSINKTFSCKPYKKQLENIPSIFIPNLITLPRDSTTQVKTLCDQTASCSLKILNLKTFINPPKILHHVPLA